MGMKSVAAVGLSLGLAAGVGGYAAQRPGDGPRAKVESRRGEPGEKVRTVEAPIADPTATDRDRLQGRWTIVSARENGREAAEPSMLMSTMTFRGNELRLALRGKGDANYLFSIDPDSQPLAMLLAPPDPAEDRPQWCLFAFERNKLRLAFDMTMKRPGRPVGFDEKDAEHPISVLELVRDDRPPTDPVARLEASAPTADPEPDGPAPPADPKPDLDRLQGRWTVMKVREGGKELVDDEMALATVQFRGEEIEIRPNGGEGVEARHVPDRHRSPAPGA